MRFHVVGLPHVQVTAAFPSCAFTGKVRRFCQMMIGLGHEVVLYAGEENDAPCSEHVVCISENKRRRMLAGRHYSEVDWSHPYWSGFNARVIEAMEERLQERDFICLIGGSNHKPIADAFPGHLSVEFGIGYPGTFAKYRVFESYSWMHMVYGAEAGDPGRADGRWFDAVIPNQVDDGLYDLPKERGDYALYLGRLIDRKGFRIAQEVCQAKGVELILAGPGDARGNGYGRFVGEVDAKTRATLMAGARAQFVPTQYVEPFGAVIIEALACGTPVITTDWGAFVETVQNGVNGFRCRSFAEFCEAWDRAGDLDNARIRADALSRYSMASIAPVYDAYFNRLATLFGEGWYQQAA